MRLRPGGTGRLRRIVVTQTGRRPQIRKCKFFECRVSNHVSVHLYLNFSCLRKYFQLIIINSLMKKMVLLKDRKFLSDTVQKSNFVDLSK